MILKREMKFFIISLTVFSFLVYILSNYFNYNYNLGGGFILKLSLILLDNNFLFYVSSIFGLVMLSYLAKSNLNNLVLILLILFGYSATTVFQKYFEPIFIIVFFLLINTKISSDFFKNNKNILYLYIYIVIYFGSSIINSFFEFSKNI